MDTTIRNLDERAYRRFKARAALEGKTMGGALTDAMNAWLARPEPGRKTCSLRDLTPEAYPKGSDRLSERVDELVYGR
jgi:plasmid stability protein